MNSVKDQSAALPPPANSRLRRSFEKLFGKWGPLWAVGFTAAATVLRWAMDGLLSDSAPFSLYYLSVVLTAWRRDLAPECWR